MPNQNIDNKPKKNSHSTSYFLFRHAVPALGAGVFDLMIFHPIDSYIKRVQRNNPPTRFCFKGNFPDSYISLYQGLFAAASLKLMLRTVKYGGQPLLQQTLHSYFPEKNPVMFHGISGGMIGLVEALLSPFDVLKVQKQMGVYRHVNYYKLWIEQTSQHFKAMPITLCRNCTGTGTFFAINGLIKHYGFKLDAHEKLTFKQKTINSAICPAVALFTSYPFDLIKTRIQTSNQTKIKGVAHDIIKNEGYLGFYKGFPIKLMTFLPRGWISFMMVQIFTDSFCSYLDNIHDDSKKKYSQYTSQQTFFNSKLDKKCKKSTISQDINIESWVSVNP